MPMSTALTIGDASKGTPHVNPTSAMTHGIPAQMTYGLNLPIGVLVLSINMLTNGVLMTPTTFVMM